MTNGSGNWPNQSLSAEEGCLGEEKNSLSADTSNLLEGANSSGALSPGNMVTASI